MQPLFYVHLAQATIRKAQVYNPTGGPYASNRLLGMHSPNCSDHRSGSIQLDGLANAASAAGRGASASPGTALVHSGSATCADSDLSRTSSAGCGEPRITKSWKA